MLSVDFNKAFQVDDLDLVPEKDKLDDIWAYEFSFKFQKTFVGRKRNKINAKI